jgi:hypothetical protein
MTELFIADVPNIISVGEELPFIIDVNTGDFCWLTEAE